MNPNPEFVSWLTQDAREGLLSLMWFGFPALLLVTLWEMFFVDLRRKLAPSPGSRI